MALAVLLGSLRSSFMIPPQLVYVDLVNLGSGAAPLQAKPSPTKIRLPAKPALPREESSLTQLGKETTISSSQEGSALSPGEGVAQRLSAEQAFLASVRREVEKYKFYPPLARKLRQTGQVVVTIKIAEDGSILESGVSGKSSYPILNSAAETILRSVKKFDPIPPTLGEKMKVVQLPINYHLE